MDSLDISSLFFTEDLLNKLHGQLDINTNAKTINVNVGHILDCEFQSTNQITTIQICDNQQRVLTYNSAQNYYQSERVAVMDRPELNEMVRLSKRPYPDGYVPEQDFISNADTWNKCKIDVAFKSNWLKFVQNKDLAYQLLLTGNRPIVSTRNSAWGDINGKILMVIREDLRQQAEGNTRNEQSRKRKMENESCLKSAKCLKESE